MAVYLVFTEPAGREISHRDESSAGAFLCTKEFADQYSLMHYRRGGEKKGVRRWQNEDGSYTKAGYEHYAEMYGWGKLRADRAEKKAEKYRDKATKAEEKLNRQKLQTDKVQHKTNLDQQKLDRYNKKHSTSASGAPITPTPSKQSKAVDKDTEKLQKENNRLQEAQLKFDKLSNKAEKYQNKADRIHKKWDEKQDRLDKYLNEDGTLNEKAMAKYTYSNGVQSKMNLAGRLKFGSKFAEEFDKQQLDAAKKRGDTDRDKVNAEFDKLVDQEIADRRAAANTPTSTSNDSDPHHKDAREWTDEDRSKATQDKIEKDNFVRSAKDKLESGEDKDRAQVLASLFKMHHEGQNNIDDPNYQEDWLYGAGDFKEDIGFRNNQIESILWEEIDRVSGNENTGEYIPGSNGAKAHDALMASYDKSWERRMQLEKENGMDHRNAQKSEQARKREYEKLKNILASDRIYQALADNDKKNEDTLLAAVLKDLGVSDSPENRSLIFPIVFRD